MDSKAYLKKYRAVLADFFSDKEDPDEPKYDPLHVGAMVVITLFALSALFWLLWAALVFGGGIPVKVIPALKILFGSRTPAEFGYVGAPYEMGVFEGWLTNVVALALLLAAATVIWRVYRVRERRWLAACREQHQGCATPKDLL